MPPSSLVEITDANFREQVDCAATPVLVAFTSPECGVCRAMRLRLEALAAELGDAVRFGTCEVAASERAVQRVEVRRLPTIALFARGEMMGQLSGLVPELRLREFVARALGRDGPG